MLVFVRPIWSLQKDTRIGVGIAVGIFIIVSDKIFMIFFGYESYRGGFIEGLVAIKREISW